MILSNFDSFEHYDRMNTQNDDNYEALHSERKYVSAMQEHKLGQNAVRHYETKNVIVREYHHNNYQSEFIHCRPEIRV